MRREETLSAGKAISEHSRASARPGRGLGQVLTTGLG